MTKVVFVAVFCRRKTKRAGRCKLQPFHISPVSTTIADLSFFKSRLVSFRLKEQTVITRVNGHLMTHVRQVSCGEVCGETGSSTKPHRPCGGGVAFLSHSSRRCLYGQRSLLRHYGEDNPPLICGRCLRAEKCW